MTLSLPPLSSTGARPLAIVAALAWTTLTIGATVSPAPANAAEGAYYRAELTAPAATPGHTLAGGLVWKCAETACAAPKGTSRPAIVCARLAKEVGPVTNFTAGGKALEAEDLARCNGK
jgi:hypothetical protein